MPFLGSGILGRIKGYKQWGNPVITDPSSAANTSFGSAGGVGDGSQGVAGWIPMIANVWKIASNKISSTPSSGQSFQKDQLYLPSSLALNSRIAIQGDTLASPAYYTFGNGFNPTTGEGYMVVWNQATPYIQVRRLYGAGSYPSTAFYGVMGVNLTYAGGQGSDWCILERTVLGKTSTLKITVCPNLNGHPDYANPRVTKTYYDTYAPLAVAGYAYLSSCVSPYGLTIPRVEISTSVVEFTTDGFLYGLGKSVAIALTGKGTSWQPGSVFTASSGLTINSVSYTDQTHVTLNCTTGANLKQVVITEPRGATQVVRVCKYAVTETRTIYAASRATKVITIPPMGGVGSADFVATTGGFMPYGIGFSLDGNYIYVMTASTTIKKYNLAAVLQSTITVTGSTGVRKMITLADGTYIVCDYSGSQYILMNADDTTNRVWNKTVTSNTYGLTQFYDNALARNTILTAGWANSDIKQWELDGTLIKTWASGNGMGQLADLAVDSNGDVIVCDWTGDKLHKYSNAGVYLGVLATTYLLHPHSITILSDDTILVTNEIGTQDNFTYAYAPDGSPMGQWSNYFTGLPVDVEVYPLPAPVAA